MRKFNILVLLFMAIAANAQIISGKILSKEDGKGVPYARIAVVDESFGTIADEKGNFSLDLTKIPREKTVKIEVGGYEIFNMPVSTFIKANPQNIFLREKVKNIDEVTISPKKLIEKNWGVTTKSASVVIGHNASKDPKDRSKEVAILFRNRRRAKIEKIHLNIAKFNSDSPVFARFTIYDANLNPILVDDLNDEITAEKIIDHTYTFNTAPYNIWVNGDFYIGLQLLNFYKGQFYLSGSLTGGKTLYRENMDAWQKVPLVTPALNIDVKVEK